MIYGALGLTIATSTPLFGPPGQWPRRLAAAALPMAALCDLVENHGHKTLLRADPGADASIVPLAAGFASAKWLLVVLFTSAIVVPTLRCLWRRP